MSDFKTIARILGVIRSRHAVAWFQNATGF